MVILGSRSAISGLDQPLFEKSAPRRGTGRLIPTGAFVLARPQAGPGCRMSRGQKSAHVRSQFGQDDLSDLKSNAWNGVQALLPAIPFQRAHDAINLLAQNIEFGVQVVDMLKVQPE